MIKQTPQFDVTGHEQYWKEIVQENKKGGLLAAFGMSFGISWANHMEKLMQGNPLTKEIVAEAMEKATPKIDAAMGVGVLGILCKTWVHGDQLIPFAPYFSFGEIDPDVMTVERALTSDETKDFVRNYPDAGKLDTSTVDGQDKEAARILATVLKNKKTIDAFEKVTTNSKDKKLLNSFISLTRPDNNQNHAPILKIEEPDYPSDLAEDFKDIWKDGVRRECREARKIVTEPKFGISPKQAEK